MDDFDMFATNSTPAPAQPPTDSAGQQNDMFGFGDSNSSNNVPTTTLPSTIDDQQIDSSWAIEDARDKKEADIVPEFDNSNLGFDSTPASQFDNSNLGFDTTSAPQSNDIGGGSFDELSAPPPLSNEFNNDMFESQNDRYDVTDSYTSNREPSPTVNNTLFNDSLQEQSDTSFDLYAAPPGQSEKSSSTSMFDSNVSPVQAFNIRRQQDIAEKDIQERAKIDEMKQQARNELQRWYDDRKIQLETKRKTILNEEEILRAKAQEKSDKETCDWAKVVRFLEFSGSSMTKSKRDLTRMKGCILNARKTVDSAKKPNGV